MTSRSRQWRRGAAVREAVCGWDPSGRAATVGGAPHTPHAGLQGNGDHTCADGRDAGVAGDVAQASSRVLVELPLGAALSRRGEGSRVHRPGRWPS